MQVLFASGDVGGARALLPVIYLCEKSIAFCVLKSGDIVSELSNDWPLLSIEEADEDEFFVKNRVGVFVFSSSVKDSLSLRLARKARKGGVKVIHVLDSWTSYRRRMGIDGAKAFVPDVYAVMDDLAYDAAVADGIEASILEVTGQPALAGIAEEYEAHQEIDCSAVRASIDYHPDKILLIFISEPVANDHGNSPENAQFRGYTEKIVLQGVCEILQPYAASVKLVFLKHPREDYEDVLQMWHECRGALEGGIVSGQKGREVFFSADGVIGMASILLYEAWLLGKPVVSFQPGLLVDSLRMLQKRQGVLFIDSRKRMRRELSAWFEELQPGLASIPRPELRIHENAPYSIMKLINESL